MISHPNAQELLKSVVVWINELRPTLDPRNAFLARVAANALATVGREMAQGPAAEAQGEALMARLLKHEGRFDALKSELSARIRSGEFTVETPELLAALQVMARDQIAIDQPSYRPEGTPPPG